METSERRDEMPRKKIEDVPVSVDDSTKQDKKEYETFIDKQEEDDLDNQHYSEGEDYEK